MSKSQIIIGYQSALARLRSKKKAKTPIHDSTLIINDCARDAQALRELHAKNALFPEERIHIMTPDASWRATRNLYSYHVATGSFPHDAFCKLTGNSSISSPEFCFLQMASVLCLEGLIQLGLELCGTYRLNNQGSFTPNCMPLTSTSKLRNFISQTKGMRGHASATRALNYILDGSASPMESQLFMRLCLPVSRGGYGCPMPIFNKQIDITDTMQKASSRGYFKGDLYWPQHDVLVEYNGYDSHASPKQLASDARRDNAMNVMDTKKIVITQDIFSDKYSFAATAEIITKLLKKRTCQPSRASMEKRDRLPRLLWEQENLTRLQAPSSTILH